MSHDLGLNAALRRRLWDRLTGRVERYIQEVDRHPVTGSDDVAAIRAWLADCDFSHPLPPERALDEVVEALWKHQIHTAHPGYYGLFNPRPTTMGIVADTLVAAFNPQLAAWGHNPVGCEIERHLVRALGERFGYARESVAGSFTSGGAEANHTALLVALAHAFPSYLGGGAASIEGQPVLYVTEESHHTFVKAAMLSGIGSRAVVSVGTDDAFRMDVDDLARRVARDRAAGRRPFLVVATLGTTNAGLIDPVAEIAELGAAESLWVHADAAWGGAAVLVPELRGHLAGVERADSITFDAHKWLSVPMGAGIFLTRHPEAPGKTFAVGTDYMPVTREEGVTEPHLTTMQWSRRFTGLKLFMSLLVAGWEGYEAAIRHQTEVGRHLRGRLGEAGWGVVNDSPLPTLCFVDARPGADNSAERLAAIAEAVVGSGRAWISTTKLGGEIPVLRACVTNYRTTEEDADRLVEELERARRGV